MQIEETLEVTELEVLTDETPAENPIAQLDGEEEETEEEVEEETEEDESENDEESEEDESESKEG